MRICRVNDFFQASYGLNLESKTVIFLNLVRKSFRQGFSKCDPQTSAIESFGYLVKMPTLDLLNLNSEVGTCEFLHTSKYVQTPK